MGRLKGKIKFQTIIYLLLAGAFAYSIIKYRDQLADIYVVLQEGVWYLLLGTALVLAVAMYNQATWYASIYKILELPSDTSVLLPLYLVRRFVTVAAPSGGFSGWVPFLQFARQRDLSVGVVFIANLVYTILWYSAFFIFLLFGLVVLFISHDLQWFEISAALVMLFADIVMITGLVLAWFAPHLLDQVLRWLSAAMRTIFGWLRRQPPLAESQFMTFADDLNQGVTLMRESDWHHMLEPIGHALLNETLHIVMFYMCAFAFGVKLNFGVLVAAYSISILFYVVSPTPGGLGFVEGTLILVLTSLGVRAHNATVITLAYRGITFWLPFILGFIALRWFRQHPDEENKEDRTGQTNYPTASASADDV